MSRSRRPARTSGDDRERAILATAEELLASRSITDVSVDDLARGAGISRPTFYFYFPSKEAVLLSLLDTVAAEARSVREEALSMVGDSPVDLWRRGVSAICETFTGHRGVMLAVGEMLGQSEQLRKLWAEILDGFVTDTTAAIESELQRGAALPGVNPRHLAVALNWMNERVISSSILGQEPTIPDGEILEVLLRVWSRAVYGDDSLGG